MAQKLTKIAIFWQKRFQNAPKFGLEVYLGVFYIFPKFSKCSTVFG